MKAVREGETGVNRAALEHNVPKTTLKDQLSERVEHGKPIGRAPFLTPEKEKELYEFLVECVRLGYPKTRVEAIDMYVRRWKQRELILLDSMGRAGPVAALCVTTDAERQ